MRFFLGIIFIAFTMQFFSCSGCAKQAPRLRSADRKIVDSLYKKEVDVLKVELDSICDLSFQDRVDFAVDSIMTIRLEERKRRLGY